MQFIRLLLLALWLWAMPATLASAVIAALIAIPVSVWHWPWFVWLLLSPTLYFGWLVALLLFCAPGVRRMGMRFPKPRYATLPGDAPKMAASAIRGLRQHLVSSLPLVQLLQQSPWGRKLVVRAHSPSLHIGAGARILGTVRDFELVEVGERVIIGAGAVVAAHAWTAMPNGKTVYVTAPVKIGARATVGAGSLVSYGCVIGENSLIEPMSYLPPFTEVPAGEVWGGRPASFQRKRARIGRTGQVPDAAG